MDPPRDAAAGSSGSDAGPLPADVAMMRELLRSMNVDDYEPRVVNMLMDFMYRYVTDVVLDAEVYSEHLGKQAGHVDLNGLMLAIQSRTHHTFIQPPPQERVAEAARVLNDIPLPELTVKPGLPLPPESKQLTAPNYQYDPDQQYTLQR